MKAVFLLLTLVLVACSGAKQKTDAYGNFSATEIILSSETAGKIISRNFEQGQKVKKGEIILIVDTLQNCFKRDELQARKQSVLQKNAGYNAQILVLTEQKKALEADQIRFEKMLHDGASTPKQSDDIANQIRILDKQIEQVKTNFSAIAAESAAIDASIAQVNDLIVRSKIIAPSDGTLLEIYVEPGESVTPAKVLIKLADLYTMELKAYFSGDQLPTIQLGQEVNVVTDAGAGELKTLKGRITWIASEAEFTPKIIQTREERLSLIYAVKIEVINDGSIKINMPGEVVLN